MVLETRHRMVSGSTYKNRMETRYITGADSGARRFWRSHPIIEGCTTLCVNWRNWWRMGLWTVVKSLFSRIMQRRNWPSSSGTPQARLCTKLYYVITSIGNEGIRVAFTRMQEEGADRASRGNHLTGAMNGTSIINYVPLHLDAISLESGMKDWLQKSWDPNYGTRRLVCSWEDAQELYVGSCSGGR
jgi:hypothetical protein